MKSLNPEKYVYGIGEQVKKDGEVEGKSAGKAMHIIKKLNSRVSIGIFRTL